MCKIDACPNCNDCRCIVVNEEGTIFCLELDADPQICSSSSAISAPEEIRVVSKDLIE